MTSGKDIRDEQVEYRQSVEDRFIAGGLANSDVQAAARRDAEDAVRQQQKQAFDNAVNAALEDQASKTGADDTTTEE